MAASDEYKGPIVYETLSGTDIQAKPSNDNYSILEDEPLYFEGCAGSIQFNGGSMPTFLGNEVEPGIYEYYILQKSVINPEKTSITSFRINQQLVSWTDTWRDRLYWDDEEGCYMIEKNANFVRVDGTDSSAFKELNVSYTRIEVDGCPNSMDDYVAPYVRSNWTVAPRKTAVDNDWRAIVGTGWTANEIVCFMNFGYYQPDEVILSVFINNPLNATFPAHNQVSNGSLSTSGAIPVEGVRVERTGLKKKIKLKQYKGGTIYSMVSAEQALKSSVTISIPTMETKYVPRTEIFEGTSITINDPNYKVTDVYFEGLDSIQAYIGNKIGSNEEYELKGAYEEFDKLFDLEDDTFVYKIKTTSADGLLTKYTDIVLPDAMLHFSDSDWTGYDKDPANPFPHSYTSWSEEHQTYMCYTNTEFLYLDNIDTFKYGQFTKTTATQYLQWVERPAWKSPCLPHLHVVKPQHEVQNNYEENPWGGFANLDTCEPYYMGAYVQNPIAMIAIDNNQTGAEQFRCMKIVFKNDTDTPTTDEGWYGTRDRVNEFLSKYPIEMLLHRINPGTLTAISSGYKKKIKLPYFGAGTTYTLERYNEISGNTVKANIKISVDLKYDFKIAYRIFDGRDIKLKNMEGRIIRNEQPVYLEEVRGNSELKAIEEFIDNQYVRTETIKLLGTLTPRGWYSYNIYKTNASGKTETINFELPEMLCWWPGPNSSRPTAEVSFECPSQDDILYWDAPNKCYKIKRRTGYYFANSAYSDIEFLPYVYKNENIGPGAWEFYTEGIPNDKSQFGSSSYADINTNYIPCTFHNVYSTYAHSWGAVFPVIYDSNSTGAYPSMRFPDNVFGIYTTATTLDELNVFLANRPFHLITAAYYQNRSRNNPYPIRNTNITKPVKIDISNDDVTKGVNLKVMNGDIDARFKIAVPVTYTEIDVPTPTYDLGAPKDFNGTNVYVNTNIQLFNQAKDFTILLDYQHKTSDAIYVANDRTILHCRYENTGTSYRQCGLAVETTTAPEARIRCATDYSGEVLASPYTLNMYQLKNPDSVFNELLYRYRTVIVYKAGLPYKVIQAGDGEIIQEYELYMNVPPFRAHTRPLYLGCQNSTSDARSRYFAGRINECKVWDGVALTDGQILKILGDGPYPKESFTVSNKTFAGNQTSQVADNQLDTGVTIFDPGFTDVDFTIFLEFDKGTGGSSTPRVLCCTDATNGYETLSVHSEDSRETFNIRAFNGSYYELLKNPLPSVNDHYKFFICYRAGMVDSVIDYSTGVPVRLELADTLPTSPPSPSSTFYNVLLGASPFSSLTDTRYVWGGTIKHCKIWKHKLLSSYDMDYVVNNILK